MERACNNTMKTPNIRVLKKNRKFIVKSCNTLIDRIAYPSVYYFSFFFYGKYGSLKNQSFHMVTTSWKNMYLGLVCYNKFNRHWSYRLPFCNFDREIVQLLSPHYLWNLKDTKSFNEMDRSEMMYGKLFRISPDSMECHN